jgi:predicted nucleotide-binding protein (sugar kinase/HSP70/actin superfamily)
METLLERADRGEPAETKFKGFDLGDRHYQSTVFECKACPNLCEVNKVIIGGDPPIFYGARCDRFEEAGRSRQRLQKEIPDLFAERNALLLGDYTPPENHRNGRLRLAIPRVLTFYDLFSYWRTFFNALDIELILSEVTNPKIISHTSEQAVAETCFPAKLVYGHVINLLDKEADFMFLPSVVNRENIASGQMENAYCPFIPAMAHLVTAHIDVEAHGYCSLKFPLHMLWAKIKKKELKLLARRLNVPFKQVVRAEAEARVAQQDFYAAVRARGREVLDNLDADQPAAVIVGRPYNACDSGVCQGLPFKLRKLGVLAIPMDYLPLDSVDVSTRYRNMFWRSGQDILAAATIIRDDPRLQAIYLTNFNCGPDSFIINFFRRIMGHKPFLELEMDDHTADAGVITRCEAFFESLKMGKGVMYE